MMNLLSSFFAPLGQYPPCGMFTAPHIIAATLCFAVIIVGILLLKNKVNELLQNKITRFIAPILTILEAIKIAHSFINGDLHLDAWFPLSFCGLFIFAVWMSGFGKAWVKNAGDAFIAYGGPVGGIAFMIFPTTSLMSFPIWHYFSVYSLIYHSSMTFWGILFLIKEQKLNAKRYLTFAAFICFFAAAAIPMNSVIGCNLMNLREPYNIPIPLLQNIYSSFPPGYTLLVLTGYLLIPPVIGAVSGKHRKK